MTEIYVVFPRLDAWNGRGDSGSGGRNSPRLQLNWNAGCELGWVVGVWNSSFG